MRRELLCLILLAAVSAAALDQTYVHTVARNGSSIVENSRGVGASAGQLTAGDFERMQSVCDGDPALDCDVDAETRTVIIRERLQSGGYYSYSADYGFPSVSHTMRITGIPSDRFDESLNLLLAGAAQPGRGASEAIDLTDPRSTLEIAEFLRALNVKLTYVVNLPVPVSEAGAGNVTAQIDGNSATFDLVDVMLASEPMEVRGSELNLGLMAALLGAVVLVALAAVFMRSVRAQPAKPRPAERKKTKK